MSRPRDWAAWAAAGWALIFAGFHFVWAAGWYPLLDAARARAAFANWWMWGYDVAVALLCMVAAWAVMDSRRPLVVAGFVALALRMGASILSSIFWSTAFGIWEWWFSLGALLFGLASWRRRGQRRWSFTSGSRNL
jgi:hypothetical protein